MGMTCLKLQGILKRKDLVYTATEDIYRKNTTKW